MRRALAIAVLLASATAHAQVEYENPWTWQKFLPRNMRSSPLLSKYVFTSYGEQAWRAPAPTIDCRAAASGGDLVCSGASFVKAGGPVTTTSPYYFGGAAQPAVLLNGSTDYYDAGDVGDQTTAFSFCVAFKPAAIGANMSVLDKDSVTARSFSMFVNTSGVPFAYVWDAGGNIAQLSSGVTTVASAWNVWCGSYSYVGAANSVFLQNVNGVASASNAMKGPMGDVASHLVVGGRDYAASRQLFNGAISRVSVWSGTALSAADLALAVRAMQASLGTKNEVLTTAVAQADYVQVGSGLYLIPANTPRISAPTGMVVWGASSNLWPNTEDATAWTSAGTPTMSANAWTWAGGATGDTITDDDPAVGEGKYIASGTVATGPWTMSCWLGSGTASTARLWLSTNGTGTVVCNQIGLTAGGERRSCSGTVGGAPTFVRGYVLVGVNDSDTGSINVAGCSLEQSTSPGPYRACGASPPCAGGATVPSTPNPVPALTPRCVAFAGSAAGAWNSFNHLIAGFGSYAGANSAHFYYSSAGRLQLAAYDSGGNQRFWYTPNVSWADSSRHSGAACWDVSGNARVSVDQVEQTLTAGGSWSGAPNAEASTIYLGSGSTGAASFYGHMERACVCKGSNPLACEKECLR